MLGLSVNKRIKMSPAMKFFFTVAFSACLVALVSAYSSGAPPSDEICTSMRPNHPGEPQATTFPYGVKVDKLSVKAGEPVTIQMSGTKEQPFRGFLMQARKADANGKDATPMGTFLVGGNDVNAQTINCGGGDSNAITHANGEEKTSVKAQWMPPKEPGTYMMYATGVQSGKIYWVGYQFANVTVA